MYILGGDTVRVSTEAVAVQAYELAPAKFSWRDYPDQIDKDLVRVLLYDARKAEYGSLVVGRLASGWTLTANGLAIARKLSASIKGGDFRGPRVTKKDLARLARERIRIEECDAYIKAIEKDLDSISTREAEALFRLNSYIDGQDRERKVIQVLNMFSGDEHFSAVLREVATRL